MKITTLTLNQKFELLEEQLYNLYENYKEKTITKKQYEEYSKLIYKNLELLGYYKED